MIKTIYNAINIKAIKMQFFSVKIVLADFSNEKVDMNRILTKIKVALIKEEII